MWPRIRRLLILVATYVATGGALADLPVVQIDESSFPYNLFPSNYGNLPSHYDNSISNYDNSWEYYLTRVDNR